ncbi:MAG TPA: hypothetical protein VFN23_01690, partial [Ktedonobacteraceae bacterium]|nr:hypothetical protein [Ktedonobacteraceae bacterium]
MSAAISGLPLTRQSTINDWPTLLGWKFKPLLHPIEYGIQTRPILEVSEDKGTGPTLAACAPTGQALSARC